MRVRTTWMTAVLAALLVGMLAFAGCAEDEAPEPEAPAPAEEEADAGLLVFVADGEDHAREGTVSKEGWNITFEHAYVTLTEIAAYQTDPPHDVDADGWDISYDEMVALPGVFTIDLAAADSDPAVVGEVADAPAGFYNAFGWHMVRATSGPAEGYVMMFVGSAEKDGETVDFTLRFDRELEYLGGEYIGDVRKGILEAGGEAEGEMTFHFDHFFGRADKDPEDEMNVAALGFDPIAALAVDGVVDVGLADLEGMLDAEDFAKLEDILLHFGHIGENHCIARPLP